jgi:3-oxoacyl-[acyl-carrier-protein] synthase-3
MLGLRATAYELGATRIELAQWCGEHGVPPATLAALRENGARQCHVAGAGLVEMGCAAIAKALAVARLDPGEVDVLVAYNTSPCNTLPMPFTLAGALRQGAGLRNSLAFAINLQMCASPVHAMRVLAALFERHPEWRHAVLAGADKILLPRLRTLQGFGVHSDGAGALVLGPGCGNSLSGIETYNEPDGMQRTMPDPVDDGAAHERYRDSEHYLWTLISVARRILRGAGVRPAAITSVLPHNVNLPAWRQALAALGIARERLFDRNFGEVGHLFGSDIAVNLTDSNALRTPGNHLVMTSGVGGCFAGFVLQTGTDQ